MTGGELLVLPDPEGVTLPQVRWLIAQIPALRDQLRENADQAGADDLRRKLEAFTRYVADKVARDLLRAETRRTEVLLGDLLGTDVEAGRSPENVARLRHSLVPKDDRHRFRLMARYAPRVEELLADGNYTRKAILDRLQTPSRDADPPPPDSLGTFPILLADPPWQYDHSKTRERDLGRQYPTSSVADLQDIQPPAAQDAVLFCWATSPKLAEALALVDAWGFTYRTCMVWVKDRIGMGFLVRQQHELLLIARRGNLPTPLEENRPPSVFTAPRGDRHSAKPDVVYELIEAMYPGLGKVEMFARTARPGWARWGNEAPT